MQGRVTPLVLVFLAQNCMSTSAACPQTSEDFACHQAQSFVSVHSYNQLVRMYACRCDEGICELHHCASVGEPGLSGVISFQARALRQVRAALDMAEADAVAPVRISRVVGVRPVRVKRPLHSAVHLRQPVRLRVVEEQRKFGVVHLCPHSRLVPPAKRCACLDTIMQPGTGKKDSPNQIWVPASLCVT